MIVNYCQHLLKAQSRGFQQVTTKTLKDAKCFLICIYISELDFKCEIAKFPSTIIKETGLCFLELQTEKLTCKVKKQVQLSLLGTLLMINITLSRTKGIISFDLVRVINSGLIFIYKSQMCSQDLLAQAR